MAPPRIENTDIRYQTEGLPEMQSLEERLLKEDRSLPGSRTIPSEAWARIDRIRRQTALPQKSNPLFDPKRLDKLRGLDTREPTTFFVESAQGSIRRYLEKNPLLKNADRVDVALRVWTGEKVQAFDAGDPKVVLRQAMANGVVYVTVSVFPKENRIELPDNAKSDRALGNLPNGFRLPANIRAAYGMAKHLEGREISPAWEKAPSERLRNFPWATFDLMTHLERLTQRSRPGVPVETTGDFIPGRDGNLRFVALGKDRGASVASVAITYTPPDSALTQPAAFAWRLIQGELTPAAHSALTLFQAWLGNASR